MNENYIAKTLMFNNYNQLHVYTWQKVLIVYLLYLHFICLTRRTYLDQWSLSLLGRWNVR